ncbi:MAG: 50S ribosomal protein L6 [Candidatus Hydrogenedens sp.]|nr:50S ribosomal protein L6 [Candidatus Hydrogenedens sp.]
MSRVGKAPIAIPAGVKCELSGRHLKVTGPKGTLEIDLRPEIEVSVEDGRITAVRPNDRPETRAYHGMTRALINNMVLGVTNGFSRTLEIHGTGWRCNMAGDKLNVQVGYSHPVEVTPPPGINIAVEGQNVIVITGIDKAAVGQAAADIRAIRKPEPYKGKGIRYRDEWIRRKEGKAGGKK